MKNILLVEPEYKNKFPPIGLMKIATFHRSQGDRVEFFKGEAPYTKISKMDRIYITTLFTFHYDISIKCIRHYAKFISTNDIFVGGIAASLMPEKFRSDTNVDNILTGQLTDSRILGYKKKINIDSLSLDYDILDDVPYKYPASDNYFIYTTRGCPRGCEFCAVKNLEPEFFTVNNILKQVGNVDSIYGTKRNLIVMDNNILFSPQLSKIINDIQSLGFNGKAEYIRPNPFKVLLEKIRRRQNYGLNYSKQINDMLDYLKKFRKSICRYNDINNDFSALISSIEKSDDKANSLFESEEYFYPIIEKFRPKLKIIRHVDFNQGIDARLINKQNISLLASIPIKPFRLAYDSVKDTKIFINATRLAMKFGIKEFSNYILYNWTDKPEDLWDRLHTAINIYNTDDYEKITGFSFPMKYTPIERTDRTFIGKNWNKKFLSAINVIINVTKGVVAKEKEFFYEAFGRDKSEFLLILNMPNEFIRFRHFFREKGITQSWEKRYKKLTALERRLLLRLLCEDIVIDFTDRKLSENFVKVSQMYTLTKYRVENEEIESFL